MNELIKQFNNAETHVEVDVLNQYENGTTDDRNIFTYTVYIVANKDNKHLATAGVDNFSEKEIKWVITELKRQLN